MWVLYHQTQSLESWRWLCSYHHYHIQSLCNLLQQNFSRGIFWVQTDYNHVTLYRYDYTLSNPARQEIIMMCPYTLRIAHEVGVPVLYFMSPNPYTDYSCFIFSDPKYISASPTPAMPISTNSEFSGSSMPPTAPNTITSPTMNLIILLTSFLVNNPVLAWCPISCVTVRSVFSS